MQMRHERANTMGSGRYSKSHGSKNYKTCLLLGAASAVIGLALAAQPSAAATLDDIMLRLDKLERSNNKLEKENAELRAILRSKSSEDPATTGSVKKPAAAPSAAAAPTPSTAMVVKGPPPCLWQIKPGSTLTICTPGGEVTAYGNFDISFDYMSKNVGHLLNLSQNTGPVGNFGWLPDISTNLSYFGARGFQKVGDYPFNFVYQFEAGFEISATPGNRQSNSNLSNGVNGALFARNTYIGIASKEWGAIKIGKTDAPYKTSTAIFNPFNGMIGDYSVVMGNTGGDNRTEFLTRLSHSVWYESPNVAGFQFNALFSPGQNRSDISDNLPSAESDCAGGNDPTSGNPFPPACTDGGFSNAVSANLSYTWGGFYATAAYERHFMVNRQSDIFGIFGIGAGNVLFDNDVADEDAAKVGALYNFKSTGTTVGGIFESMHRYVPSYLAFQNERQRNGTWLFVSQQITDVDSIHFGWAHAFGTPGDPGQHNDAVVPVTDPFTGTTSFVATTQNQANMVTSAYKRKLNENLTWYTAVAATFNQQSAHYDLGAGGRGVTTDCHDASLPANGGSSQFGGAGGHCFTGTTIMGVSTGIQYRF
jgi:predicted porin